MRAAPLRQPERIRTYIPAQFFCNLPAETGIAYLSGSKIHIENVHISVKFTLEEVLIYSIICVVFNRFTKTGKVYITVSCVFY